MPAVAKIIVTAAASLLLLTPLAGAAGGVSDDGGHTPVRRYLLSAGANNGGRDKVLLRYAVSDAQAFAAVLIDMGGVDRKDAIILANPGGGEFLGGIATLGRLLTANKKRDVRNEVFVYYSGHADQDGLRLGGETLSWADFRNAVNGFDADIRVAVLDACGSGAITRARGGVARPAFLADASMNMTGYAFLTSSNEREASQESDRIRSGYFTHALLNGMRGAADMVGDGKVTINEAYQYAFNETLRATQNTIAGTQHPSRDMNLAGTGDIVMTDLRQTSARLSLPADTEGRFFIRSGNGHLFSEISKPHGRKIELGIPPGKYTVYMETPLKTWMASDIVITHGKTTALLASGMRRMSKRRVTVARGDGEGIAEKRPFALLNVNAGGGYSVYNDGRHYPGAQFGAEARGFLHTNSFSSFGAAAGANYEYRKHKENEKYYRHSYTVKSIYLQPVYRMDFGKTLFDLSFTADIPVSYLLDIGTPDGSNKVYYEADPDYTLDFHARYGYMGFGIEKSLMNDITLVELRGFLPVRNNMEIVTSATYRYRRDVDWAGLRVGVNYLFK